MQIFLPVDPNIFTFGYSHGFELGNFGVKNQNTTQNCFRLIVMQFESCYIDMKNFAWKY